MKYRPRLFDFIRYNGFMTAVSDEYKEKVNNEPFKKHFSVQCDGMEICYAYYEIHRKDIDDFVKSCPKIDKFAFGHFVFQYKNGTFERIGRCRISAKKNFKAIGKMYRKIEKYKTKHKDISDGIAVNRKMNILGFKRLRYCNNQMEFTLPFALFEPKRNTEEKLPLVLFLHGYTNGGESNIQPFTEFFTATARLKRKMKENPCFIAVPSLPKLMGYGIPDDGTKYAIEDIFDSFFEKLIAEYPIDTNRVYIIGCSNGAMGTWSQLRLHPERYAAAIPMMGMSDVNSEAFFEGMKNNAIWVCHAENDMSVRIGECKIDNTTVYGSDILVDGLKKAGNTKVKYTRYTKYGHTAARKFLKKEDWCTWIFAQKEEE